MDTLIFLIMGMSGSIYGTSMLNVSSNSVLMKEMAIEHSQNAFTYEY
jgi:hypothetical protein